MASNFYKRADVNGNIREYTRKGTQGRKSRGLVKWSGYLSKESLDKISEHVKDLRPYYDVSLIIRLAVDNYVMT